MFEICELSKKWMRWNWQRVCTTRCKCVANIKSKNAWHEAPQRREKKKKLKMAMKCQACGIEKKRGQFDTWKSPLAVSFAHRSPTKEEKNRSLTVLRFKFINTAAWLPACLCKHTDDAHERALTLTNTRAHTPNRLLSSHCEMLSITCIMPDSLLSGGGTQPMNAICYVLCLTHTPFALAFVVCHIYEISKPTER